MGLDDSKLHLGTINDTLMENTGSKLVPRDPNAELHGEGNSSYQKVAPFQSVSELFS